MTGDEPAVEQQHVRVVEGGSDGTWALRWSIGDDCRIEIESPDRRSWSGDGWNMFVALIELRRQLDPLGIKVCCQGARTRAALSGMAADAGRGMVVYRVEIGRHASREDLVGLLESAPVEEVGTVEEQAAYRDAWLASPKRPDPPPGLER